VQGAPLRAWSSPCTRHTRGGGCVGAAFAVSLRGQGGGGGRGEQNLPGLQAAWHTQHLSSCPGWVGEMHASYGPMPQQVERTAAAQTQTQRYPQAGALNAAARVRAPVTRVSPLSPRLREFLCPSPAAALGKWKPMPMQPCTRTSPRFQRPALPLRSEVK
jgi:hypothetical protein